MTDWRLVQKPVNGQPGQVEKVRTYILHPVPRTSITREICIRNVAKVIPV